MSRFTPSMIEAVAERFRTLGEPMRLRVLDALRDGERSVGELVERLGASQANISKHLQLLHARGFVARRREGTTIYYRIPNQEVFRLCDLVCGSVEQQVERQRRALQTGGQGR